MLFATGLVAGGTLTGVFSAILKAIPMGDSDVLTKCQSLGEKFQGGIGMNLDVFATIFFVGLGFVLVKVAMKKTEGLASKAS